MSEQPQHNPYQVPATQVLDADERFAASRHPRSVPAANGIAWIGYGWDLFMRAPGALVLLTIIYMIINFILGSTLVAAILGPIFIGGYFIALERLDASGELRIEELFAPFQSHLVPLLLLGVLMVGGTFLLFGVAFMLGLGTILGGGSDPSLGSIVFFLGVFVLAGLLFVLLYSVVFYGVILVVLGQQRIGEALPNAIAAFLKNILPFLLNGIIGFVIILVALIPFGLGLLVATPVLFGAMYASFRDIFAAE